MSRADKNHDEIISGIATITERLTNLIERVDIQNGRIYESEQRLNRYDVFWGKVGVIVVMVGAAVGAGTNLLIEWVRSRIF